MDFYQTPPELLNQYEDDEVLKSFLRRYLPASTLKDIEPDLKRFGEKVAKEVLEMALEAEENPPVHVPYDPWGKRIDHIKVSRGWQELDWVSAEEGIVAT